MDKKLLIVIASLALVLTGFSVPRSGLFKHSVPAQAVATSAAEDYETEAARRHCLCQPRHWRALMLYK